MIYRLPFSRGNAKSAFLSLPELYITFKYRYFKLQISKQTQKQKDIILGIFLIKFKPFLNSNS